MAKHLGIDFSWILIDFGAQVGAKLGSKIDQKSINKLSVFQQRFCLVFEGFRGQGRSQMGPFGPIEHSKLTEPRVPL